MVTLIPNDKVEKAFSFSSKPQLRNTYIIMKVLNERLKSIIKLEYRVLGIMISFKNACNASSFFVTSHYYLAFKETYDFVELIHCTTKLKTHFYTIRIHC